MNSERTHKPAGVTKPIPASMRRSAAATSKTAARGSKTTSTKPGLRVGTYAQWSAQVEWFNENFERLFASPRYRGRCVAIKNKRVIATDTDEWRLLDRMRIKHPDEYVLVIRVAPAFVHEVPTTEIA